MGVLWERLGAADPGVVADRCIATWHPERLVYTVPLLTSRLSVSPQERRVEEGDSPAGYEPTLVCVQYLLNARNEPPGGEMVSPRSLPYGDFFFRGQHVMPTAHLADAYGTRLDAFRSAAQSLGGVPRDMADAAYEFRALPRVPVTVLVWGAGDEFPARVQFLLDSAATRQLPVDALWVLGRIVAKRLAAADPQ